MRSSREKAKSFWPAGLLQFYVGCFNGRAGTLNFKNHPIPVPNDEKKTTSLLLDRHIAKGAIWAHGFSMSFPYITELPGTSPWHEGNRAMVPHPTSNHRPNSGSKGRRQDKNSKSISLQVRLRKAKPKIDRDFDVAKNDSTIWLNELKEETMENSMQFRSMRWELQHSKI